MYQCLQDDTWGRPEIVEEVGDYSVVRFRDDTLAETISNHCDRIRDAVQGLIETYSHAFRVDFQLKDPPGPPASKSLIIYRH